MNSQNLRTLYILTDSAGIFHAHVSPRQSFDICQLQCLYIEDSHLIVVVLSHLLYVCVIHIQIALVFLVLNDLDQLLTCLLHNFI